jgi:hypothetical protein
MGEVSNRILVVAILLIFLLLVGAGVYFFVITKGTPIFPRQSEGKNNGNLSNTTQTLGWETYTSEKYKYRVKYSPLLTPREIQSDVYLDFVIFYASAGSDESGFAISVRENSLGDEVSLIKEEIHQDVSANLISEESITLNDFPGERLKYEPEKPEEGEPRTIIIINNGDYSYSLSSRPEQIEDILATFELLD